MKSTSARSSASKWSGASKTIAGLTAEEADLLEPPPLAAYEPWVVPLTVRLNAAADEMADE
jgi:hypothetical protein